MSKRLSKRELLDCVEVSVNGIPCLAHVTTFEYWKPNRMADNPYDYYGGYDIEYMLHDRKGYYAPWLERIADNNNLDGNIREQITDFMEDCYD